MEKKDIIFLEELLYNTDKDYETGAWPQLYYRIKGLRVSLLFIINCLMSLKSFCGLLILMEANIPLIFLE
ncbi:hypothetical protein [Bacillus sp. 7894-2]|uniref:hypothetical protein n=1 Tax=Bacillus sp. 7894-2 TaxID=2021695 RepID=UPI000BA75CCF|nr:hypothetical protein [Bacillus sp. 7894-2]PAE23436.1 hypothetical protein CHI10_17970 [Bacillus sp. 7894-2]